MTTIYLIRHADAGSRSNWNGDDFLRPLSDEGRKRAKHIAKELGGNGISTVLSSPSIRCVQTVEPLADAVGVKVQESDVLLEGTDPTEALDLLGELRGGDAALCTHGDIMPEVIELLISQGMEVEGKTGSKKGSYYRIERRKKKFATATYHRD